MVEQAVGQIPTPADAFPVSVVIERRQVRGNRWITESWNVVGVTLGDLPGPGPAEPRVLIEGPRAAQFLWTGLKVRLYPDEAESYYHNLTVDSPGCYVVVRPREDGIPRPVLVTLSFDAAQAYQEGGETVYNVPLPAPLYRATEAFVLAHYCPEQRHKRQLTDWREGGDAGH